MENLGLFGAIGVGLVATLSAPILVWALVVSGLRQVAKKSARAEKQSAVKPRRADA